MGNESYVVTTYRAFGNAIIDDELDMFIVHAVTPEEALEQVKNMTLWCHPDVCHITDNEDYNGWYSL